MKWAILVEVKPGPFDDEEVNVLSAISEAWEDLVKQAQCLFTGVPSQKSVILMPVAGEYWSYRVVAGDTFRILSQSADDSYVTDQTELMEAAIAESQLPNDMAFYRLGRPESNEAMKKMWSDMRNLDGFKNFSGKPL